MAKDIETYLKENEPINSLEFIAIAVNTFFSNIGYIFSQVFLLNLVLIALAIYLITQLDFQFNYSYLSSSNGLYVAIILTLLFLSMQSLTRIQLTKRFMLRADIVGRKLSWRLIANIIVQSFFQILFSIISTFTLVLFFVIPSVLNMIFPITSTYFHLAWIHVCKYLSSLETQKSLLKRVHYFWRKSYLVGLISRILLFLTSIVIFISLFIIYEFTRVFLGGELFVFIEDRIFVLKIISSIAIIFFLFFSSITYLCFIIIYDYISLKKDGWYLKQELEKIISDDSCRTKN